MAHIEEVVIEPIVSDEDFRSITIIEHKAFRSSPLSDLISGSHAPVITSEASVETLISKFPSTLEHRYSELKRQSQNFSSTCFVKASLKSTAQVVGMGRWHFFLDPENFIDPFPDDPTNPNNSELRSMYLNTMKAERQSRMSGKKYILMGVLVVHPDYQRRGIGQQILDWGLKQADELEVPCWVDASKLGLGLYLKNGWKPVSCLEIDLEKWGGPKGEVDTTTFLIREPKSSS